MNDAETICQVIENYTEEEFEADGYQFTWKAVEALVRRIRELELALLVDDAWYTYD